MTIDSRLNLAELIAERCRRRPERIAFVCPAQDAADTFVSADLLLRQMSKYRQRFLERGVDGGDVVLLAVEDGIDTIAAFLGAMWCGAIPCIFPSYAPKLDPRAYKLRLQNAVSRIQPSLVVGKSDITGLAREFASGVRVTDLDTLAESNSDASGETSPSRTIEPTDVAFLQLSSGSTNSQKPIAVTHAAVCNLVHARNEAFGITAADVVVGWVPLYHDLGIVGNTLGPLLTDITAVMISPLHWLTRPAILMQAVHRHRATVCTMPNFALSYSARRVTDQDMEGVDLSSWRVLCNAAEPIRQESLDAFATRFAKWGFARSALAAAYGLAENTLTVSMTRLGTFPRVDLINRTTFQERNVAEAEPRSADSLAFVTCGIPLSNVRLEIHDDDGFALPERHIGEVVIRSNSVCAEYHPDERSASQSRLDGWLRTGDRGYVADGELFVCGRIKDVIVVGGANIYAEEVETVASQAGTLRSGRVAVFGLPDARNETEQVALLAELQEPSPTDVEAVRADVRARIKQQLGIAVGLVEFVPKGWICKTTSGKIARWENRAKWMAGPVS